MKIQNNCGHVIAIIVAWFTSCISGFNYSLCNWGWLKSVKVNQYSHKRISLRQFEAFMELSFNLMDGLQLCSESYEVSAIRRSIPRNALLISHQRDNFTYLDTVSNTILYIYFLCHSISLLPDSIHIYSRNVTPARLLFIHWDSRVAYEIFGFMWSHKLEEYARNIIIANNYSKQLACLMKTSKCHELLNFPAWMELLAAKISGYNAEAAVMKINLQLK